MITRTTDPTGTCAAFLSHLRGQERAEGTIQNYMRAVRSFQRWLGDQPLTPELCAQWKVQISGSGCAPSTANAMLAAVNKYLRFLGREDCLLHPLRLQRRCFCEDRRELTREEYHQLLSTASALGRERLALLLETICSTGIRVSELPFITVEAACSGRAQVSLKGKIRTVLIPSRLCRKLLAYARERSFAADPVFQTRAGAPLSRRQVWAEMKELARRAGIPEAKVFPHNLRHLFARTYYHATGDVARLADILGHASMETTRIYLISTGAEHARQLDHLGLVR